LAFEWSVGVVLDVLLRAYVRKLEVLLEAVCTANDEFPVSLRPLCHVSDAQTADVVLAAARLENHVEIPKADRAAVLVEGLARLLARVLGYKQDFFLRH